MTLWISEALPDAVDRAGGRGRLRSDEGRPRKAVFAPFADPLIFLFIGSFILARAIFLTGSTGASRSRVLSLPWAGTRPSRILFAFGAVTALISAWISNTATTAMMFGIGMSILAVPLREEKEGGAGMTPLRDRA